MSGELFRAIAQAAKTVRTKRGLPQRPEPPLKPQPSGPRTLIMTVGVACSGKTPWCRRQGVPIVCPDSVRLALHGRAFVPSAEPTVWAMTRIFVDSLFRSGHREVILDATNTTRARREEWKSDEWERRFVLFDDRPVADIIERLKRDKAEHMIPIVERMAAGYEKPTPIEGAEIVQMRRGLKARGDE